jgi:hypothetical protein
MRFDDLPVAGIVQSYLVLVSYFILDFRIQLDEVCVVADIC